MQDDKVDDLDITATCSELFQDPADGVTPPRSPRGIED